MQTQTTGRGAETDDDYHLAGHSGVASHLAAAGLGRPGGSISRRSTTFPTPNAFEIDALAAGMMDERAQAGDATTRGELL